MPHGLLGCFLGHRALRLAFRLKHALVNVAVLVILVGSSPCSDQLAPGGRKTGMGEQGVGLLEATVSCNSEAF